MKFYFNSSNNKEAIKAKEKYISRYGQFNPNESDVIIPIGGDGFLLKSLHDYKDLKKPFYGINYGSIGFLMNSESKENLEEIILNAQNIELKPLQMKAKNNKGDTFESIAFNEVSLMRQTHLASKVEININDISRMKELICDGVLISTPAGSTAYNLSAHGTILPLDSKLLALTPISAFRPRRWRGALLSENSVIELKVIDHEERQASVTSDNFEFRNIKSVQISSSKENICHVLFDSNHSMEDKILNEQFEY